MEVAKLSGFPLGIATRRSLKAIYAQSRLSPLGITTSTVAISLYKGHNFKSLKGAINIVTEVRQGPSGR